MFFIQLILGKTKVGNTLVQSVINLKGKGIQAFFMRTMEYHDTDF